MDPQLGHRLNAPPSRPPALRGLWARFMSLFGMANLIVTIIPVMVIIVFVYRVEQSSWQGRQAEAAENAAATVGAFVQRAVDTLALTALWGRNELRAEPEGIGPALAYAPAFLEVLYLDERGQVLGQAQRDHPVLASLFTITQSAWFRAARAGQTYLSDVQLSAADTPYLILAHPVGAQEVIAARLDLTELWRVVADLHFGRQGRAYILNGRGDIIAHTDPAVVLAQTNLTGRPELAAITQAPGQRWLGSYVDLKGTPVVGASAPIAGTDWLIITELPESEAFAASRAAWLTLGGGSLLLGIVLSFVMARLLTQLIRDPLRRLQAGVNRIGQGDLQHRIAVTRQDEIGAVAEAFNTLAARLSVREAQLAAQAVGLQASEARYRAIVEDQTELICRWRPEGTLTFVNDAYCRYFDRRREDLEGQSYRAFSLAEEQARLDAHRQQLSAEQPVATLEHRVALADGRVRWLQWTDRALFGPDGAVVEFASVGHDVTERKAAEAQVRALEEYYRSLFEEAPVMYIVTRADPDGPRLVDCNRQFLETLGYAPDEVVGQPLDRFYTPASRDQLHAGGYAKALAGPLVSQERQLVARDGRIVHTLLWALPTPNERGQTAGTRALYVDITERKQAEAALRESEARLKMALEVARAGAWQWDLAANRLVWSDENYRLMGLAPGSVEPALEHWLPAIHPDDQPAATAAVALAVEQRHGFDTEFRVVWPDGSLHWLRAVGRVILGSDGFPRATVGLQQDITERKQAEAALRESEGRYRLLADELQQLNNELEARVRVRTAELAQANAALSASETRLRRITDNMLDMIVQVDADGRYEYVSPSHQAVLGYTPADLLGRSLLEFVHPDDVDQAWQSAAGEASASLSRQTRVRHAAGHYVWLESIGNSLRDDTGRVSGAIITSRNITQRKQAEARLQAAETRYRTLVENLPATVYVDVIDSAGAFGAFAAYLSPQVEALLGYPAEAFPADPGLWARLVYPADRERVLAAAAHHRASGEPLADEFRMRRADERVIWVRAHASVLRDADGRPRYTQGVLLDVTEQKQAEQRAAAFSNLGQRLSSVTTVAEAAGVVVAAADDLLGWDVCFLDYYLADRGLMHSALVIDTLDDGQRVNITETYAPSPPTETARRVMTEGGVLLQRAPTADLIPGVTYFGDSSRTSAAMLFVPIRNGARFIGLLSIQSYRDQAYDQAALETLQALADHCGGALERIRAEADVRASLSEKEVLLQEIHHRVKNNLQIISSLLSLQSRTLSDPTVLELLRDSQNRVRSMALVHEKLYRSSDLARIDLAEYADSLAAQLLRTYAHQAGRITLRVEAAGSRVDIDTSIACGLILNELVSNALKHAFPGERAGVITIALQPAERQRLVLRVADDGIGFPADVDFRTLPSLGLQLVNGLVAQIDGTITLHRDSGTEFEIEFPMESQEP